RAGRRGARRRRAGALLRLAAGSHRDGRGRVLAVAAHLALPERVHLLQHDGQQDQRHAHGGEQVERRQADVVDTLLDELPAHRLQGVHGRVGEHELAAGRHVDPQFGGLDRDVLRAHQLGGADPQAGRGAVHRDGGDRGRAGDLDARGSPVDRAAVDHGVRGAEPDRAVRDLVGGQVGDRDVLGTGRGDDPVATTVDGHAGERDVRRAALDPHAGLGVGDLRVVDLDLLAADVHPGDPGALDGGVLQLQVPGALLDDHAPASAARADVVEHDAGAADVGEDADRLVGGAEVGDRDVLDLVEPQATRLVGLGGDAADAGALLHRHDQAVLLVAVRGEPGDLTVGVLPADEHAVGAVALGPEVGHAG